MVEFSFSNAIIAAESVQVTVETDSMPTQIAGPYAATAKTLPAYFQIRGDDGSFCGQVFEPAVWSPVHPVYYRLQMQSGAFRTVGIRKNEACFSSLYMNGRRTVLRAVQGSKPTQADVLDWVDLKISVVTSVSPDVDFVLSLATDHGVPVILDAEHARIGELRNAASWPCVTAIIVREDCPVVDQLPANPLCLVRTQNPNELPSFAHGAIVPAERLMDLAETALGNGVIVAESADALPPSSSAAAIRRSCEQLQCDLAPAFNLAGYIVTAS